MSVHDEAERILTEADRSRQIAEHLRVEADMFRDGYLEAADQGDYERASHLFLSMMHAKTRAARIERELRGLPTGDTDD